LSFVLAAAGCGLSDYAGQMTSEAARVKQWDDETEVLGNPIKMPNLPKKGDKEQSWNVFLRLPLKVSEVPATQQDGKTALLVGPLAKYAGSETHRYGIVNVYLGVAGDQKDYIATVTTQFGVAAGGTEGMTVPRSPSLLGPITAPGQSSIPDLPLKTKRAEGQYLHAFYFYEHNNTQVAVVFEMNKGNGTKADNLIRMSLATLAEGQEADLFSRSYKRTHQELPARVR
jgi:hypothetical protein